MLGLLLASLDSARLFASNSRSWGLLGQDLGMEKGENSVKLSFQPAWRPSFLAQSLGRQRPASDARGGASRQGLLQRKSKNGAKNG